MVKLVVERRIMPPWFAAETKPETGTGEIHTPWANDRSLATAEKQDLRTWIAGGKPEGDLRDAPQPRKFDEGWQIGQPDAVFQFAKPVPIKATGVMPYQNIVVETKLPEDKWVQAIEVQPGDRGVVHHVLVFVQGMTPKMKSRLMMRRRREVASGAFTCRETARWSIPKASPSEFPKGPNSNSRCTTRPTARRRPTRPGLD
ncbi:MAG: hypothetical protein R3C49_21800 [Planctomycetaceae bacterium]